MAKQVKVKCQECGGRGVTRCDHCGGDKSFETISGESCPVCNGEGKHKCVPCKGTGLVTSEHG